MVFFTLFVRGVTTTILSNLVDHLTFKDFFITTFILLTIDED